MSTAAASVRLPRHALAFVAARAINSLGSAVTAFALNVWVFKTTGSYAIFATLAVVTALPGLLFSPLAGVLVDRLPRRRLLIASDAIGAATILTVLLTSAFGLLTPWLVGGVTIMLALLRTLNWPAVAATVTTLTTANHRARINGLVETLEGIVVVASPILGALLLDTIGITGVAGGDIVSYLACIAIVSRLPLPPGLAATPSASRSAPFRRLLDDCTFGFRWIVRRADLLRLLLFFSLINLGCSIFLVAYTPYILSFTSPLMLATCLALGGSGTIAGGLLFTASGGLRRPETGVLLGAMLLGACMVAFGMVRAPAPLYIAAFLFGAGLPLINASSQTIWQSQVPTDIQGRVFSVRRMIAWGLNPLSILISIPLVAALFEPLLQTGHGTWSPAGIWGVGTPGAIGLMVSSCGAACLIAASIVALAGGLRIRQPVPGPAAAEKPFTI